MDQRISERYETSLNALVHPSVGKAWLCTIKDFCDSGMLLVEQEGRRTPRGKFGINAGDVVGLHFSVPLTESDEHFRLEGKIVRVMDSGVGINFTAGMADEAMLALTQFSATIQLPPKPEEDNTNTQAEAGSPTAEEGTTAEESPPAAEVECNEESSLASPEKGAITQQSPFDTGSLKTSDSRKLVAAIRKGLVKLLPEMTTTLFKYMDAVLLESAKDSRSNTEQSEYFRAMSDFAGSKESMSQLFINGVLDHLDNPRDLETLVEERKHIKEQRKQVLADNSVDQTQSNAEEFEDWLAVANIVSRGERIYGKYNTALFDRMGMMIASWGHLEANPIGTAVNCHAFNDAIHTVNLPGEIRQKFYLGYEVKVIPLFRRLYVAVAKLLEDSGFFPELDDDYMTPSSLMADEQSAVTREIQQENAELIEEKGEQTFEEKDEDSAEIKSEEVVEEKALEEVEEKALEEVEEKVLEDKVEESAEVKNEQSVEEIDKESVEETAEESGEIRDEQSAEEASVSEFKEELQEELQRRWSGRERRDLSRNHLGPGIRSALTRITDSSTVIADIYSTVRGLIRKPEDIYFEENDEFEDDVQPDEMRELLQSLQDEIDPSSDSRVRIRQHIIDSVIVDGRQRRLSETVADGLDVVEDLVDTIEDDRMLSNSTRGWIRQLELTLNKVTTRRLNLLDKHYPHSSLNVINQLARLGGAESADVHRKVDDIIAEINQDYDSDDEVFEVALGRLQPLIERQSRAFTANVQRTVTASEGKQRLINAQRAVIKGLAQQFTSREVPEILMQLLMPGWRDLLVNTHLRQGEESVDWKNNIRVIGQVMEHLDDSVNYKESPYYIPLEELLDQIESGLDSISFDPAQKVPLISSLKLLLSSDEGKEAPPMVDLSISSMFETLGFSNINEEDEKRHLVHENNKDNEEWYRQLERVWNLRIGQWIEFSPDNAKAEIAIVAWVSEDNARIVFVNRRGVKVEELTVEDFATMVVKGFATVHEASDIPLTDRASHAMLQNMHNQLTFQATHDELTGLVNRKEFEHQLSRIFVSAKRKKIQHVVAYLDLDQFQSVNDRGGHEAGDKMLIDLSQEIATIIPQKNILARLGGDEFGLLLEDCDREDGKAIIQNVCAAIKDFCFEWGRDIFSLSVSCGVLNVDEETESLEYMINGAESACRNAKDAGGDTIEVYETDDSQLAHRKNIMDFVSQIDRCLEEDRFILNCQLIKPIDEDSEELAQYEILLTILDENDIPMPPLDFIIAAETHHRMGEIDRWVIRNAFEFIATNILRLGHLGAFTINISGNSLAENDFMEFVLKQFNETRLPASKICFEITEKAAFGNLDNVIEFIEKMQVIGVQFSLDDFGRDLSSYSYLRSLPVDYLKIDGSFVKDIKNDPSDYAVVKSINEIGHFMGKKTVAEFVEDDQVIEILKDIGVDFVQGFGVGKKVPITELLK